MAHDIDNETLLAAAVGGDGSAAERLNTRVYAELRGLAGHIARGGPGPLALQPTLLVHEAYLKMFDRPARDYRSETHFKAVAAVAMRQVLVDELRSQRRLKRGGDHERVTLNGLAETEEGAQAFDLEALEQALERLAELDPRAARVVELRFFGGLTEKAVAEVLGVTDRTVRGDWSMARAWLQLELGR